MATSWTPKLTVSPALPLAFGSCYFVIFPTFCCLLCIFGPFCLFAVCSEAHSDTHLLHCASAATILQEPSRLSSHDTSFCFAIPADTCQCVLSQLHKAETESCTSHLLPCSCAADWSAHFQAGSSSLSGDSVFLSEPFLCKFFWPACQGCVPCWCAGLQLRLLTFNRQMRIFGVMEMAMQWDWGGSITAKMQIGAVPLVADSTSSR